MPIFGIDFGYSKACIARVDNNENPIVIGNLAEGRNELAAVVCFEDADNVTVGDSAKDMMEVDGERVVRFIKRDLGKQGGRVYEFDGRSYSPVEISALILKRLKQMAEEQGESVNDVVMAMPVYFGPEEKVALKNAAEIAGLNLVGIIAEPTAAALAYLRSRDQANQNILLYDLGEWSLNVSILQRSTETENNNFAPPLKVLSAGGSEELGSKAWRDRLFDFVLQACCDENGLFPDEIDAETRQSIYIKSDMAMRTLSSTQKARVRVVVNGSITSSTSIKVSREKFENITLDLAERTMTYVEQTLQKANNIKIDTVLLVGGAARMPMIHQLMETRFPGKVQLFEPDYAVAIGAAIFGQMLSGNPVPIPQPNPHETSPYSPNLIANMVKKGGCQIDKNYKMQYVEKILRAAIIAMDTLSPTASEYLLREIPWETLSTDEIIKLIKIVRTCPREVSDEVLSMEGK